MKEKFKHSLLILVIILLSFTIIAGCAQAQNGSEQPGTTPAVTTSSSMANPAAVFCREKNHQYAIRRNPDGSEYGVCIFPDRAECEEWAFYQGTCNESTGKFP